MSADADSDRGEPGSSDEPGVEDRSLEVLLIEDNPGDARLIEEMLRDTEELSQRIDPDATEDRGVDFRHETRLSEGLEALSSATVDVLLLDLNLPDSTGMDTVTSVDEACDETPFVVLTGLDDQGTGVRAIQHGAQDYLVKDEVTSALLVRTIHHAIERHRQERERARRRQQLERLNRLNRISQDITHAVITMSTRTDLEQRVCERLVESDGYRFAWIGRVNPGTQRVVPNASAGVNEGYLEEIDIQVDDDPKGPTATAVQTEQVQVVQDVRTDPAYEPWRETANQRGYRSSVAIPIVYEGLQYGVLNVYASTPEAFTEAEQDVFTRLGDVIGHAITAIERKDALVTDAVLELEFQAEGVADSLVSLSSEADCTFRFERLIRGGDDSLLVYGAASGVSQDRFQEVADDTGAIRDVRFLTVGQDEYEFELSTPTAVSLFEAVATHGGQIRSATIADGEFRFIVEFPRGRDTRQIVELITDHCENATHIAQRTVERSGTRIDQHSVLESDLTEKQRSALETSFYAGYFDWPRGSTGEEIAERLGISPATFNQHLRAAERKFFESVFEG